METLQNAILANGRRASFGQLLAGCVCAGLLALAGAAQAQIVQNGSFEAPPIADGTLQRVPPASWNGGAALMNPSASGSLSGNPFTWPQAPHGEQYEDIGNSASFALSQTFTLAAAGVYAFVWQDNTALNIAPGFKTAPYSISLLDSSAQQVFSFAFDSYHADGSWQERSFTHELLSGTYTLAFTSLNLPNRTDTLIDAVAVGVVPEPGTAILVSVGLGGLAISLRRSRRAAA